MKNNLIAFINKQKLFNKHHKIVVAVSGGIDSIALCYLLYNAGFSIAIAHCNFRLRGKESDEDEIFVKKIAQKLKIPFFLAHFNTKNYSESKGISIQMAARDLRYAWFEEIRKKNNYDYIAIAHHGDDEIETFFINLIRGTGLAGFHGIKPKMGKIVRPLMYSNRKEIEEFVKKNKIKYREDSSNASLKYIRNKVRHELIPFFKKINPEIEKTIHVEINRIRQVEQEFLKIVEEQKLAIVTKENKLLKINIEKLIALENRELYLYEFLKPYGFSGDIIHQISDSLTRESGKKYFSSSHRIIKDRSSLILSGENQVLTQSFKINKSTKKIENPICLQLKSIPYTSQFSIRKENNFAMIDLDKLSFPLILRNWEAGDYFHPFGMKGKKKLSDFFTDLKLSLYDKENSWLLCNKNGDIIWVVGYRISEKYKISTKTKNIYFVEKIKK